VCAVPDPRRDGVEQVPAAQEMLHAAYERLSAGERSDVDAQLAAFFANGTLDPELRQRIESYEPADRLSEMHSVFGTEVAVLPARLEAYYARYFDDRTAVTAHAAAYHDQFRRLDDQVDAYEVELRTRKLQLE